MTVRRTAALAWAVALALPAVVSAQDTSRVRDTTRATQRSATARRDSSKAASRANGMMMSTPRAQSQMRLPVQKDGGTTGSSNGTLVPTRADSMQMRADSIARAQRDSIDRVAQMARDSAAAADRARADSVARVERARQDSIAAVEAARRDSTMRADSIAAAEQLRMQEARNRYRFNGSGWYIGLAGGGALPSGDFQQIGYKNGYDITVPIGWHAPSNLLGFRIDLGYSQFKGQTFVATGTGGSAVTLTNTDPKVLSATLNLTARVPLNTSRSVHAYAVGGGGLYHFRDYGNSSALGGFLGGDTLLMASASTEKTRNKFGAEVGGGFDFGSGPVSLFVESRLVNVFADRNDSAQFRNMFGANRSKSVRWVPIIIGVNIR